MEERRPRRLRQAGGHHRRRPPVPARGSAPPPPRPLRARRRRGPGLAQRRLPRQGPALHAEPRAQRAAQRRVLDEPSGQQERLRHLRPGGVRGPLHVPRQLLLLAVVRDGGGPRQGLLVPPGGDALRGAAPGRLVPRRGQRAQSLGQVGRRSRHRGHRVPRLRAPAGPGHPVPPPPPGERSLAAAEPRVAPALRRLHGGVQPDALDDHARRRALLRDPAQDPVARPRADPRAPGREAAPPGAPRLPQRALLPAQDAGAPPPPGGHARPGRPLQAALPHQGGHPPAPLLRHHVGEPRQGADPQDHAPAAPPASPSSATPTAPSSRCAGPRPCAPRSGRATASATPRSASGTRPWA